MGDACDREYGYQKGKADAIACSYYAKSLLVHDKLALSRCNDFQFLPRPRVWATFEVRGRRRASPASVQAAAVMSMCVESMECTKFGGKAVRCLLRLILATFTSFARTTRCSVVWTCNLGCRATSRCISTKSFPRHNKEYNRDP